MTSKLKMKEASKYTKGENIPTRLLQLMKRIEKNTFVKTVTIKQILRNTLANIKQAAACLCTFVNFVLKALKRKVN